MKTNRSVWNKIGRDAQAVCRSLHIPLHHASFAPEYWTHVFEPFVEGISQGIHAKSRCRMQLGH